jgi:hypothetical protein
MKHTTLAILSIMLLLVACSQPPEKTEPTVDVGAIQTAAVQTAMADAAKTATASIPTETLRPTETFTPAVTPTFTLTPTITFTPTNSPILIPLNLFVPLTFVDGLRNSPNEYVGKHIKALTQKEDPKYLGDHPLNTYWLATADFGPRGVYVKLVKDDSADNTVDQLESPRWMWIYGIVKETNDDLPLLSVTHIESIPDDQYPRGDGIYRVKIDIAPGRWKSMSDATDSQSCYWARIASDGSIIDNFFGYGGAIVQISETDFAVEFKDCWFMVYLGK